MKRIQSACLEQTIHFMLKEEGVGHEAAVRAVEEEYRQYTLALDKKKRQYRIVKEERLQDGSIQIMIRRQYNDYSCGDYLK